MTIGKLEGKVFIDGGAGFLPRALYRRAFAEGWDCTFTAFSRDDQKHARLNRQFPEVRCIRGDIADDVTKLEAAMLGHDIVIHAAAAKYVDLAEMNAFETVRQNVLGSENVIKAAVNARVKRVIGISTDKACGPVNVYGLTKAIMERLFFEAGRWTNGRTAFSLVRYGNVIGSTGSVFTRFQEQVNRGEPLQITNPEMTRFYLTADEAVDILLAAVDGKCLIPLWLKQMSTMDLARAATGSGPDDAAPCHTVIGQRPGEKVHESLMDHAESARCEWIEVRGREYLLMGPPGFIAEDRDDYWTVRSNYATRMDYEGMAAAIEDAATI